MVRRIIPKKLVELRTRSHNFRRQVKPLLQVIKELVERGERLSPTQEAILERRIISASSRYKRARQLSMNLTQSKIPHVRRAAWRIGEGVTAKRRESATYVPPKTPDLLGLGIRLAGDFQGLERKGIVSKGFARRVEIKSR